MKKVVIKIMSLSFISFSLMSCSIKGTYSLTISDSSGGISVSDISTAVSSSPVAGEYKYVTPEYTGAYYSSIGDSLRGTNLIKALDALLDAEAKKANRSFSYGTMWEIYPYTDADPANPSSGKILSFYSGKPSVKSDMNREHVWPDSRSGGSIENDPHMPRPSLVSENSDRGNSFFNDGGKKWDPATFNNAKYRGIAARIIFYCAVKAQENGLKLVDLDNDSTGNKSMGKLSRLLQWNFDYPIDASETLRNDVLFTKYKWCRNPFIDDRNYACKIWGETNDTTRNICKA